MGLAGVHIIGFAGLFGAVGQTRLPSGSLVHCRGADAFSDLLKLNASQLSLEGMNPSSRHMTTREERSSQVFCASAHAYLLGVPWTSESSFWLAA